MRLAFAVAPIAVALLALGPAGANQHQTLVYVGEPTSITVYGDGSQPLATMFGQHISPWGLALGRRHVVYSVQIGDYRHNGPPGSVAAFSSKNGRVADARFIKCHMKQAWSVAVDGQENIHVTDPSNSSVVTFAQGSRGCAQPTSVLSGSQAKLGAATGIAIDSRGRIIVSAGPYNWISIHAPGASGNAAPVAVISGPQTQLGEPEGVAVDAQDHIWATNYSSGSVTEYAANANGNATPMRVIAGPSTGLSNPIGIAVSKRTGIIYVANYPNSLLAFAPAAQGDTAPIRVIHEAAQSVAIDD